MRAGRRRRPTRSHGRSRCCGRGPAGRWPRSSTGTSPPSPVPGGTRSPTSCRRPASSCTADSRFPLPALDPGRRPRAEEPADAETIDPVVRGSLVHETLETFSRERRQQAGPVPRSRGRIADDARVQEILTGRLEVARRLGLTGLAVFAGDAEQTMRADLTTFLVADGEFRRRTGATPWQPRSRSARRGPTASGSAGSVDRIDRVLQDGPAWVMDYKTGRVPGRTTIWAAAIYAATAGLSARHAGNSRDGALLVHQRARRLRPGPVRPDAGEPGPLRGRGGVDPRGRRGRVVPGEPSSWNDFYAEFENCGR